MKVEQIRLRQVRLQLLSPFTTSFGTIIERPCIIVEIRAGGGGGLAECVAFEAPWYSYETVTTAWHVMLDYLIPSLVGQEIDEPEDVWGLFARVRGHNMAKAALEMACWDLFARSRGLPLAKLLGGTKERVPVGVSVGIQSSPQSLVETVSRYIADGYGRIKLKIAPGKDVEFVAAVRESFRNTAVQVDANSAYSLSDVHIFTSMDDLGLLLIEQPLGPDDIVDHRKLQLELKTPLCLDESIHSPDDARHALDLQSCRVINIKAGRVGGHQQSRLIHDLCLGRGAPVWCGGMLETNIGRAHNVALSSLPGFTLPGDISASSRYYERDIAQPSFELNEDSTLTVPSGSGIGVELGGDVAWERVEEVSAGRTFAVT